MDLKQVFLRQIMCVLGSMMASIPGVIWTQLHSRSMQSFLPASMDHRQDSLDRIVNLPLRDSIGLVWWSDPKNLVTGRP